MDIDIRTPGVRMPRAQRNSLQKQVRSTFEACAHRIRRVVLRIAEPPDAPRNGMRDCVVEVHLQDGHVERVQERQRHIGVVLRRALRRAWQATLRWVGLFVKRRGTLALPAPSQPALLPARSSPERPILQSRAQR